MATWPPVVAPEESLMGEQAVTKGPDESMYFTQYTKPWNEAASIQYSCFAYIKWNRSFGAYGITDTIEKKI